MLRLALASWCLLAATSAAGQSVLVVDDDGGPGVFSSIQAALVAAHPGDTLLVRSGSYAQPVLIEGISLSIVGDAGASITGLKGVSIRNLARGQTVFLIGLGSVQGADVVSNGVIVENCQGTAWFERCAFVGAGDWTIIPSAARITETDQAVFVRCDGTGGKGFAAGPNSAQGGHGLSLSQSSVFVHESSFIGGQGAKKLQHSHASGAGAHVGSGFFFAAGSTFTGGKGFTLDCNPDLPFVNTSSGGAGLDLQAGAAWLLDTSLQGGSAGPSCPPFNNPGVPMNVAGGALTQLPGAAASMRIDGPLYEGETGTVVVQAEPGRQVFVAVSVAVSPVFVPKFGGVLLPGSPSLWLELGSLDGAGQLTIPFVVPELGANLQSVSFVAQGAVRDPITGSVALANPTQVVLFDAALAAP